MTLLRWTIAALLTLDLLFTCVGLFDPWLDPDFNRLIDLEEPRFPWVLLAFSVAKLIVASVGACALGALLSGPQWDRSRLADRLVATYAVAETALQVVSSVAAYFMYEWVVDVVLSENPHLPRGPATPYGVLAGTTLTQIGVPIVLVVLTMIYRQRRSHSLRASEHS